MSKIEIPKFRCRKCNHEWYPREPRKPLICPKCKGYKYIEEV